MVDGESRGTLLSIVGRRMVLSSHQDLTRDTSSRLSVSIVGLPAVCVVLALIFELSPVSENDIGAGVIDVLYVLASLTWLASIVRLILAWRAGDLKRPWLVCFGLLMIPVCYLAIVLVITLLDP